ncbi:class I adenylate-forming enzyme family protein [Muricoccus aerilatus]|uniref:class I adenylate-forming enzyme family protein n=1 Tax=Muricoccus aerilatus TaxID=452982 RepID=UPI0009FEEE8D|nr:AMP-binding protein [Roseomonas aerilata]
MFPESYDRTHGGTDSAGTELKTATDGAPYIDLLLARLAEAGEAPVLRYHGEDYSAAAFAASIFRYARALASLGIGPGHLVALFAPNAPSALAVRYAAHLLGAAAVYLSAPEASERRAELIERMDPQLLVLFAETAHLCPPSTRTRIGTVGMAEDRCYTRIDHLAAGASSEPMKSAARPSDLAVIVSSGGTTGVPKGSCRSFAAYTATVRAPSPKDRRQLVNGPLAYLSQVLVDMTLLGGGAVILQDRFEAASTLAAIEAERATHLFLVEPQLLELMDHPDVSRRDLSSLRVLTHVGASAPPSLRRRALERFGPVLAHVYGASEMGLVSLLSPAEYNLGHPALLSTAGKILPGVDVRFRRADGRLADPWEPGRIEVRSPSLAGGYRNLPEHDADFHDGWFRSGDFGFADVQGYLHVLGRIADLDLVDGTGASPVLLEDALCGISSVRYAVVVAEESGYAEATRWLAAIEAWVGMVPDVTECRAVITSRFGAALAASVTIMVVDRVPRTEQGKPDREAIRQRASRQPQFCSRLPVV